MKSICLAILAVAIVVVSALANAASLDRWGLSGEPETSAAKLHDVPLKIGDWIGTDKTIDTEQLRIAGAEGHLVRRYAHAFTPKEVTVMLLCGKARPISFHPPEVCYAGAGYGAESPLPNKPYFEPGAGVPKSQFFMNHFNKEQAAVPERLQIYWAWARGGKNAKGEWEAPNRARSVFRSAHALHKLYVIRQCAEGESAAEKDACAEFLEVLLPELHRRLFASS